MVLDPEAGCHQANNPLSMMGRERLQTMVGVAHEKKLTNQFEEELDVWIISKRVGEQLVLIDD